MDRTDFISRKAGEEILSLILADALEIKQEHLLDVIVHIGNPGGRGVFGLGNPDRRGGLVLREIQVRGGVKKRPHPSGVCGFFLE